jgi:hypothetical protein
MSEMKVDEGDARLLAPVTERVISCAFTVANALDFGRPKVEIRRIAAETCLRQGFGRQA